ncbi:hypothetical protein V1288_003200 [Bradyrhizobium sp. AZCC 2176]
MCNCTSENPFIHETCGPVDSGFDASHRPGMTAESYFPTVPLLSKNTPCSPNMFQTHQGRFSGTGRP